MQLSANIFNELQDDAEKRNRDEISKVEPTEKDTSVVQFTEKKSPMTALYLSAIPGMGQYYVESYTKASIFFAGSVTLTALMIKYNNDFVLERDKLSKIIDPRVNSYENIDISRSSEKHISLNGFSYDKNEFNYIMNKRELYRDNRDRMGFFLGVVYLISAVDAFVGANLYEFDVNDNLSSNFRYSIIPDYNQGISLHLTYLLP